MDNLQYLYKKSLSRSNKNLEVIRKFFTTDQLQYLSYSSVSIIGTNGKTSTATVLNELLHAEGLKTCLFTSPHLVTLNERIQINKDLINNTDLEKYLSKIISFEKKHKITLGYFESLFLIAASYFIDNELDIFIVEAGIGGRLDTTSIISSRIVCLTNVSLDHTELLGNSIQEILLEKILISQKIDTFIVGSPEIHQKYENFIKDTLNIKNEQYILGFGSKDINNSTNTNLKNFVRINQDTAIVAAKKILQTNNLKNIQIPIDQIDNNLSYIKPSGRFQILNSENNIKIIDGAHNPGGVEAFFNLFEDTYSTEEITKLNCYIGFNKNKDFKQMLDIIWSKKYVNIKVLEKDTFHNQLDPKSIETYFGSSSKQFKKATLQEFHITNEPSILLGSLYLVGEYIKEYK